MAALLPNCHVIVVLDCPSFNKMQLFAVVDESGKLFALVYSNINESFNDLYKRVETEIHVDVANCRKKQNMIGYKNCRYCQTVNNIYNILPKLHRLAKIPQLQIQEEMEIGPIYIIE